MPRWKKRFAILKQIVVHSCFPAPHRYDGSKWAEWAQRVREGHGAEEKRIAELAETLRAASEGDIQSGVPDDWLADGYWQACRVTRSMYAALVVSIWSDMEYCLKWIISFCQQRLGKPIKPPYRIDCIKKFFADELGIDLEHVPQYEVVDAIRLLNNCFKHKDGHYEPKEEKLHDRTADCLLMRWHIVGQRNEIDYSKLDMRELVEGCNAFCEALLEKVAKGLQNRHP